MYEYYIPALLIYELHIHVYCIDIYKYMFEYMIYAIVQVQVLVLMCMRSYTYECTYLGESRVYPQLHVPYTTMVVLVYIFIVLYPYLIGTYLRYNVPKPIACMYLRVCIVCNGGTPFYTVECRPILRRYHYQVGGRLPRQATTYFVSYSLNSYLRMPYGYWIRTRTRTRPHGVFHVGMRIYLANEINNTIRYGTVGTTNSQSQSRSRSRSRSAAIEIDTTIRIVRIGTYGSRTYYVVHTNDFSFETHPPAIAAVVVHTRCQTHILLLSTYVKKSEHIRCSSTPIFLCTIVLNRIF